MSKPLYQKLGMKEDTEWCILNRPNHYFDILGGVQNVGFSEDLGDQIFGIHFFATRLKDLQDEIPALSEAIAKNGMIWISWYKKSSKKWTDIDEDLIRATILPLGLVDVKVCRVDDDWSALKLVWRKERR